ncbi:uncharacterized protein LOC134857187 [Symsagittifera roscoffensis]|uniref:uncharacterized protein LOC134857187 n=1 Tax=Symsagittifera roscoffensis TaxID=84072 RepID=UPI00307CA814
MIRVNSDGLELSTDGSTEKNRFKLCHVSFVSAAFTYSHCAAIICQSVSSPTKWRAYLLLFSKPKYAKRFAVFMARQFDVGYEKWQSEQAAGTLDLAVEQEALKLKSRLKQGLTNKTFVLDDEDDLVITPKTSTSTPGVQHAKTFSDTGNEAGDKTEHSSEHNCPTTNNSGQISHVTSSSSSVNEVFAETHNEDRAIADQPRDSRDQSQMSRRIVGTRPQSVKTPTGFPSQSVPQHLLDSREGYNEFANAERELCSLMKGSHVQKDHSSSPILDDPFASRTAASWAPHQDPFMSFFEMRNSNMDPSDTSFSSTSLFSTQMSNGGVSGFTPFENIEEHKVGEQEENQNQNFLLEL